VKQSEIEIQPYVMKCSIWSGVRNSYFSIAMVNVWTRFSRTMTLVRGVTQRNLGPRIFLIKFEAEEIPTFISTFTVIVVAKQLHDKSESSRYIAPTCLLRDHYPRSSNDGLSAVKIDTKS
jgi:hypothetical protein